MRHGTLQLSEERARHGAWHPATGLVLRRRVAGFYSAVDTSGNDDPSIGIGASYSGDMNGVGYRAGVGYQSSETAAGIETANTAFSLGANIGDLAVAMSAAQQTVDANPTDETHWGIGAAYTLDAFTFGANYGEYSNRGNVLNRDTQGYAVTVGYDLGGGASILAGMASSEVTTGGVTTSADRWNFGLSMSF